MPESVPIPVRLSDETIARLETVAVKIGTNRAGVIRLCIQGFLEHFASRNGKIELPADWKQILAEMDGRRGRIMPKASDQPPADPSKSKIEALAEMAGKMAADEIRFSHRGDGEDRILGTALAAEQASDQAKGLVPSRVPKRKAGGSTAKTGKPALAAPQPKGPQRSSATQAPK